VLDIQESLVPIHQATRLHKPEKCDLVIITEIILISYKRAFHDATAYDRIIRRHPVVGIIIKFNLNMYLDFNVKGSPNLSNWNGIHYFVNIF
jgi:hypothetical protein